LPASPILRHLTAADQSRQSISSNGFPTADVDVGGTVMILQLRSLFEANRWGRHLIVAVALVAGATRCATADDESFTESSGPFDAPRDDLGSDDDLSTATTRRVRQQENKSIGGGLGKLPDPLKGTPLISPQATGQDADTILSKMIKPRTDSWADWYAPLEPLHRCGEPRALPPCVPPPPCHPSLPPAPYDLVGVQGVPSCGPIYDGPCQPRTGTHDNGPYPRIHRIDDRIFDWFYTPRTPILP